MRSFHPNVEQAIGSFNPYTGERRIWSIGIFGVQFIFWALEDFFYWLGNQDTTEAPDLSLATDEEILIVTGTVVGTLLGIAVLFLIIVGVI